MTKFIGREKQLNTLMNVLDSAINFNLVVIHGPPSSGKSLILNHVLKEKKIQHIYISCRSISTAKQFFDVLLNGIRAQTRAATNAAKKPESDTKTSYLGWREYSDFKHCTSASILAHILQNEDFSEKRSLLLVLDHFERLSAIQPDLVPSLIEMAEIEPLYQVTESKVGLVLVADSSAMLCAAVRSKNALPICFEQYSNKQLKEILALKTRPLFSAMRLPAEDGTKILTLLVNAFHFESRRIDHFVQYLALLLPDIIGSLKRGAKPNYDALVLRLYERLSKSQHSSLDFVTRHSHSHSVTDNSNSSLKERHSQRDPDLPFASKLLLLSSYLASYNMHRWNQYQFAELHTKRTKRKKTAPRSSGLALRVKGPQTFTLRDLSGIFLELFKREAPAKFAQKIKQIHDIHSQIAHLISLSLIAVASRYGTLDDAKFKCNIHHRAAAELAKGVGIQKWHNYVQGQ